MIMFVSNQVSVRDIIGCKCFLPLFAFRLCLAIMVYLSSTTRAFIW